MLWLGRQIRTLTPRLSNLVMARDFWQQGFEFRSLTRDAASQLVTRVVRPLRARTFDSFYGTSGRCRSPSANVFTSSMIFAYARVVASSPVHGTASGVSWSVWK